MKKKPLLVMGIALILMAALTVGFTSLQANAATSPQLPSRGGCLLGSGFHQQNYLTYLVKDYAPETLAAWQAALADRNKVMAEAPKPGNNSTLPRTGKRAKIKNENYLQGAGGAKLKDRNERASLSLDLEQAIRKGDRAQVKADLAKLLELYRQKTASIKAKLDSRKTATPNATE